MKKSLTAILLLVVGLTLTGCTLLNKGVTQKMEEPKEQKTATSKIGDLFGMNINKECTYSITSEDTTTTGHVYISGKKMAHTTTIKMEDKEQLMNYIMDENWLYSWGDGIPSMKMNLKEMEQLGKDMKSPEVETPKENEEPMDYKKLGLNEDMNLDCKNWNVDSSKFDLPKGIEFMDITKTMSDFTKQFQQTTEKADGLKDSMCGACNMTPDEQTKKECLASLGCN